MTNSPTLRAPSHPAIQDLFWEGIHVRRIELPALDFTALEERVCGNVMQFASAMDPSHGYAYSGGLSRIGLQ
jgi:hypothetical protein